MFVMILIAYLEYSYKVNNNNLNKQTISSHIIFIVIFFHWHSRISIKPKAGFPKAAENSSELQQIAANSSKFKQIQAKAKVNSNVPNMNLLEFG